jgi:hypothetical protein
VKNIKVVETTSEEIESITCDKCKKVYSDIFEIQEFIEIEKIGGYASVFEDGTKIELDLCQHCFKDILGNYIRIKNYL